jgi:dolichol-phosphate mannosyltransferase
VADVLVIVPTYNELESLAAILGRIRQSVPEADVLVVDDASPDGTGELADTIAADDPGITVLHRAAKQGLGVAYRAGFEHALSAGYDYVVEMDADGSHDPADLPRMLELARNGADLVIGSRWVPGGRVLNWPWIRQAISRTGNAYSRTILGSRIRDLTSGFRVFDASALRSIDLASVSSQGYCFQVELAWVLERAGKRVAEHPIVFVERAAGRSKMHFGIVTEALIRVTLWGLTRRRRGR